MDLTIPPIAPPQYPVDPTLRTLKLGPSAEPVIEGAIDAAIPEVGATTEARFKDFDRSAVTHVVIK